eukprot:5090522-Prymnesium_polylepis.1
MSAAAWQDFGFVLVVVISLQAHAAFERSHTASLCSSLSSPSSSFSPPSPSSARGSATHNYDGEPLRASWSTNIRGTTGHAGRHGAPSGQAG